MSHERVESVFRFVFGSCCLEWFYGFGLSLEDTKSHRLDRVSRRLLDRDLGFSFGRGERTTKPLLLLCVDSYRIYGT